MWRRTMAARFVYTRISKLPKNHSGFTEMGFFAAKSADFREGWGQREKHSEGRAHVPRQAGRFHRGL